MLNRKLSQYRPQLALVFVLIFVGIGVAIILAASAATPTASIEPESGIRAGGAQIVSSSSASGGSAVRFAPFGQAPPSPVSLTAQDLANVSQLKIFFGHQSVGMNIRDGIPEVYASYGVPSIRIISPSAMSGTTGGYFAETTIGQNLQPLLKNSDFESRIRGGIGSQVHVAFMKYCYVDILSSTDTTALFNQYRTLMAGLVRDYPSVKFLYVTSPLTANDVADNVARERFNQLIRQEYGSTGRLFDIAKVESTAPNGSRVSGSSGGNTYYSLYSGYTSDGGHLNTVGRQAVAKELLTVIANAIR